MDFPNTETTLPQGFGDVIVTDTLPEGWEFTPFSDEAEYLIYPADAALNTTGLALNPETVPVSVVFGETDEKKTATFTFTNLNNPYVILVKAKPTAATFDGYLEGTDGTDTRNETNTLRLHTTHWQPGKTVTRQVRVDSKVLNKTLDLTRQNDGILIWWVDYTPFEREVSTGLEDILSQGIDLRTDSGGALIWEQDGQRNINVHKLALQSDGSYALGDELSLEELQEAVSYDNDTRKLEFVFPVQAQAYRLSYTTDITGMPGQVSNEVRLIDDSGEDSGIEVPFTIEDWHGTAIMGRSGYLVVKKTDISGNPLAGAEFTLYNTNADGSKGSARGSRISAAADGTVKFYGLAPGNYILEETQALPGYDNPPLAYLVEVIGLQTTINGSEVSNQAPFTVVNYKEEDALGSLAIRKTVTGDTADLNKLFEFTLMLTGADGRYTYVGQGIPGGTIAGGEKISLAHGQGITIVGLPSGAAYTVTEANYAPDGYTMSSSDASGTISTNTLKIAEFTNERTIGELTIAKTVAGNAGDREKLFDFTLELEGAAAIRYAYIGNGVPDGLIESGDTISLAHGQSIAITGLPHGAGYTVTEADYTGDKYTTVSTGEVGIIDKDMPQTAAFTNTRNIWSSPPPADGKLTISKTVAGTEADTSQKFNFTLTLRGASGAYHYTGYGIPNGTIKSGDTIALAHGESITIHGLPADAAYEVTEERAGAEGYAVESEGSSGTISANRDAVAAFTNTKVPASTGSLMITKTLIGPAADAGKKFSFTVTFVDAPDAYPYTGAAAGNIRSGDTIALAGGERITITGLPADAQYTVTEADYSRDGYLATSTGEVGTIRGDTLHRAAFTNRHEDMPETPEPSEDPDKDPDKEPGDPSEDLGEGDIPLGGTEEDEDQTGGMPRTGDDASGSWAKIGIAFFSLALAALITADFALRKKYARERNRK